MALTLTGIGVWSPALRRHSDREEAADAAAELEQLGYSAIWFPGGDARGAFEAASELLRATSSVTVATGILSVWETDPERAAAERAEVSDAYDGRFLLGRDELLRPDGLARPPRVLRRPEVRVRPEAAVACQLEHLGAERRERAVLRQDRRRCHVE